MNALSGLSPLALLDADPAAGIMALGCVVWAIAATVGLAILVFFVWCWWRICTKAGYNGAMARLMLIPGLGPLILLAILAFGEWPIHRDR